MINKVINLYNSKNIAQTFNKENIFLIQKLKAVTFLNLIMNLANKSTFYTTSFLPNLNYFDISRLDNH